MQIPLCWEQGSDMRRDSLCGDGRLSDVSKGGNYYSHGPLSQEKNVVQVILPANFLSLRYVNLLLSVSLRGRS